MHLGGQFVIYLAIVVAVHELNQHIDFVAKDLKKVRISVEMWLSLSDHSDQ
jgi:hypothetical protein